MTYEYSDFILECQQTAVTLIDECESGMVLNQPTPILDELFPMPEGKGNDISLVKPRYVVAALLSMAASSRSWLVRGDDLSATFVSELFHNESNTPKEGTNE